MSTTTITRLLPKFSKFFSLGTRFPIFPVHLNSVDTLNHKEVPSQQNHQSLFTFKASNTLTSTYIFSLGCNETLFSFDRLYWRAYNRESRVYMHCCGVRFAMQCDGTLLQGEMWWKCLFLLRARKIQTPSSRYTTNKIIYLHQT